MSRNKPRPIRRQGVTGFEEIIVPLDPPPTEREIIAASLRLGLDLAKAQLTVSDYIEGKIDPEDFKLLQNEIRSTRNLSRASYAEIHQTAPRQGLAANSSAAHINPRNPNDGIHKQKVIKRDEFGGVIGLDNV
jgi:hypothetical protein